MDRKQTVVVEIALQTHVLRTCPVHHQLFCDDEADAASAFAVAAELLRQKMPCVGSFRGRQNELTELLSETIASAPEFCPQCPGSSPEHHA